MQSINRKAFTLIEAVFSVLIASVLFYWVFSYFSGSVRGVAHSEDSLETIREIQNLTTRLRHDLYEIRPWTYPSWGMYSGGSVDIYKTTDNEFLSYRAYEQIVNQSQGVNSSTQIKINAPHEKIWIRLPDGHGGYMHATQPERERWDAWFRHFFNRGNKVIINFGYMPPLEDAFVCHERVLDEPFPQTNVSECFFDCSGHDSNNKCSYRFYDNAGKDKPLNYVVRYTYDTDGKEQETAVYGRDPDGSGRITAFRLTPIFEHATGYEKHNEPPHLKFLRFFIDVEIKFKGHQKGFGPEGRAFDVRFSVMSPALNSVPYSRGNLPTLETPLSLEEEL